MKNNWKHIGNKMSQTVAEQCIEMWGKTDTDYEFKLGKPKGRFTQPGFEYMVGIYRRKKEGNQ